MKHKEQAQVRAGLAALVARLEEGNVLLANQHFRALRRSSTGLWLADKHVCLSQEALRRGYKDLALYHAKRAVRLFKEGEK